MKYLVSTQNINFGFTPDQQVLWDIDMLAPQNSVYGLLGINGAGKTTLLQLIAGLLRPQSGAIQLFGRPLPEAIPEIYLEVGALISEPQVYHNLSGRQNLQVFATYRKLRATRVEEVLALTGIQEVAYKKVSAYSTGMKQRLGIALALLPDPELLILDEPTNGLDPQGIVEVRQLIRRLHQEHRKTIILSSHLLSEVEQVCDHLGILHQGRMVFQDSIQVLKNRQQQQQLYMRLSCADPERAHRLLQEQFFVVENQADGALRVRLPERAAVTRVVDLLRAAEVELYEFKMEETRLEDWFMELTAGQ